MLECWALIHGVYARQGKVPRVWLPVIIFCLVLSPGPISNRTRLSLRLSFLLHKWQLSIPLCHEPCSGSYSHPPMRACLESSHAHSRLPLWLLHVWPGPCLLPSARTLVLGNLKGHFPSLLACPLL